MARPSKLTEKQWIEITDRVARGESMRAISREFDVSEAAIRNRVSAHAKLIKDVANQMVAADVAFKSLPVTSQIITHNIVDELKQMSIHVTSAAKHGAAIANRLSGMAAKHTDRIDETDLSSVESIEAIKTVNAIMRTANESSALAVDLLKANKDAMDLQDQERNAPVMDISHIPVKDLEDIKAKLYARLPK